LTGVAWQQGETLIAGIGQARLRRRLCRWRQWRPASSPAAPSCLASIVRRVSCRRAATRHPPAFAALGVSPRSLALVLDGMNAVVNEQGGTAYAARITDLTMAMGGKSGTSQVRRISAIEREHGVRKGAEVPWKDRDHALFVAYAPVTAPRYVCAVVVEHGGASGGGGSAVAAPICRDVLFEAQKRDPARRVPETGGGSAGSRPEPAPAIPATTPAASAWRACLPISAGAS